MSEPVVAEYESAPTQPPPPRGAMLTIFLIVFVDLLGFGLVIPLLPFYAIQYGATPFATEMLNSVFSFCQFVASPLLGMCSDRFGRRPVLFFSQVGSVVGYLLLGWTTQQHWNNPSVALGLIYLARLIDGVSGGNISTAAAYISDITPAKDRAKGMGILGAAFGMGFIFGPGVGGVLGHYHPSYPAYAAALMSAVAATATLLTLKESHEHKPANAGSWLHPRNFLPVLQQPILMSLMLIWFACMTAYTMMDASGALFLNDIFGFGPLQVGLYFAFVGVIIASVQGGAIGKLTKRFSEWNLCGIGVALVSLGALGTLATRWQPALWLLGLGGIVTAAGRSLQTPTMSSLVTQHASRERQGVTLGMYQGLGALGRGFGPVFGGLAYGLTQAKHPIRPYLIAAAILAACAAATFATKSRERRMTATLVL